MKGVVLAGGSGSRLFPLTRVTNKYLLPVYDQPMIFYPLRTLVDAGIRDILLVTGEQDAGDFRRLLRNGTDFGLKHINYIYQEGEGGITDALRLAEHFVDDEKVCVVLGEWAIQQYCERYFIIRTCGLYGVAASISKGGNFVETMLRLARQGKPIRVVGNQIVTPTSTRDLAEKLLPLIRTNRFGIYHMTNTSSCSWYEFVKKIFRISGPQLDLAPDLAPTTSKVFGAKATRSPYS